MHTRVSITLLFSCLLLVSCGSFNDQMKSVSERDLPKNHADDGILRDRYTMQNGKMMVVLNRKASVMVKDATLTNGAHVSVSGMVKMKDGSWQQLIDGDSVSLDGVFSLHPRMVKDHPLLR